MADAARSTQHAAPIRFRVTRPDGAKLVEVPRHHADATPKSMPDWTFDALDGCTIHIPPRDRKPGVRLTWAGLTPWHTTPEKSDR